MIVSLCETIFSLRKIDVYVVSTLRLDSRKSLIPRLHQDTCHPETCIPDEQLVGLSGYIYVDGHMSSDTCCSFGIHVDCISAT